MPRCVRHDGLGGHLTAAAKNVIRVLLINVGEYGKARTRVRFNSVHHLSFSRLLFALSVYGRRIPDLRLRLCQPSSRSYSLHLANRCLSVLPCQTIAVWSTGNSGSARIKCPPCPLTTGAPLLRASPAMSKLFIAASYARRERGSVTKRSLAAPFASGMYVC